MINSLCEKCGVNPATEKHHKFSNTKLNKKLYRDFIDRQGNIQLLCYDCHHSKSLDKLTEIEFCKLFGIEPRSKSGKEAWKKHKKIDPVF